MKIKPRIRELRMEKHMTQIELSAKLGIDQTQLSRYEKGRNLPGLETLMKMEEVFDCRLNELYEYE